MSAGMLNTTPSERFRSTIDLNQYHGVCLVVCPYRTVQESNTPPPRPRRPARSPPAWSTGPQSWRLRSGRLFE
eukprot:8858701-Heterocapsa_arctica.AAC.1